MCYESEDLGLSVETQTEPQEVEQPAEVAE